MYPFGRTRSLLMYVEYRSYELTTDFFFFFVVLRIVIYAGSPNITLNLRRLELFSFIMSRFVALCSCQKARKSFSPCGGAERRRRRRRFFVPFDFALFENNLKYFEPRFMVIVCRLIDVFIVCMWNWTIWVCFGGKDPTGMQFSRIH